MLLFDDACAVVRHAPVNGGPEKRPLICGAGDAQIHGDVGTDELQGGDDRPPRWRGRRRGWGRTERKTGDDTLYGESGDGDYGNGVDVIDRIVSVRVLP